MHTYTNIHMRIYTYVHIHTYTQTHILYGHTNKGGCICFAYDVMNGAHAVAVASSTQGSVPNPYTWREGKRRRSWGQNEREGGREEGIEG